MHARVQISAVSVSLLAVLTLPASISAERVYVSPDVATTPDGSTTILPWEVARHDGGVFVISEAVAGGAAIDGAHRMDAFSTWLVSLDAPYDFGGLLETFPEDIVRLEGGIPTLFFDGSCVGAPIPPSVNVDALTLLGADDGSLLLVFDAPADVGGVQVSSSTVVEYQNNGPGPCDWSFAGIHLDVAGLASTVYAPAGARVTGLDATDDRLLVTFDIPIDLGPTPEPVPFLPGQIVALDLINGVYSTFENLRSTAVPGWSIASEIDALSCEANPGRIAGQTGITMSRSSGDVTIHCPGSCSAGGRSAGIYEGTLASLRSGAYDHVQRSCATDCPGDTVLTPIAESAYYLAVPTNGSEEGSYGRDSAMAERPAAGVGQVCEPVQNLTACP